MERNKILAAALLAPLLLVVHTANSEDRGYATNGAEPQRSEAAQRQSDLRTVRKNREYVISDIAYRLLPASAPSIDRYQLEAMLARASDSTLAELQKVSDFEQARDMLLNGRGSSGAATRALGDTTQDYVYASVPPCRIVDTRPSAGGPGILNSNTSADFYVWGDGLTIGGQGGNGAGCPSPRGEPRAVHINATVVPTGPGFLTVYPADVATLPLASLVNYQPDAAPIANAAIIDTDFDLVGQELRVFTSKATHVILDVLGYYYEVDAIDVSVMPEGNIQGILTACVRNTVTNEFIVAPQYESHVPFCFASKGQDDSRGVSTGMIWEDIPAGTYEFGLCAWQGNFGGCVVNNPLPYYTLGAGLTVIQWNSLGEPVDAVSTGYDLENGGKITLPVPDSTGLPIPDAHLITEFGSGNTILTISQGDSVLINGRTRVYACDPDWSGDPGDCDFPPTP